MCVNLLNPHHNPVKEVLFLFLSHNKRKESIKKLRNLSKIICFIQELWLEPRCFCLESWYFELIHSEIYRARKGRKEGGKSWTTYRPLAPSKVVFKFLFFGNPCFTGVMNLLFEFHFSNTMQFPQKCSENRET